MPLPIAAQFGEQAVGQRHPPVLAAFAAAHPEDAAGTVEVGHAEVQHFANAQSTTISDAAHQAVTADPDGGQQASDFVGTEDDGPFLGLRAKGTKGTKWGRCSTWV